MVDVIVTEQQTTEVIEVGDTVTVLEAGIQGPPGPGYINLDGGFANSTYGGVLPIDCGGAAL